MTLDAYRDTFRFAARYWLLSPRLFGLMIVARIASNLVDIFVPLASGALVDTLASGGGDPTAALRALAHLIGLVVAFHALRTFVAWALIYVSSRAMEALVRDAFARVQRFSSDWHANSFAVATVRKITRGMWSFDQLGDTLLFGIFPAAVVVIGATTLLVSRWPLLGGVVAIGIAVYLSISVSLSIYWIAPAGQAQQRLDSALGARLADALAGNQVVKDFAAEAREDASFAGLTREWRQAARLNWTRDNTTGFLQSLTLIAMQAALLGSGLILWSRGSLSTGDVVSVIGFQGLLNAYLRDFGQHVRNVQKAVNEMEDVVDFDGRAPDIFEAPNARSLRVSAGEIVFEDVSFAYPNSQRPLYQKLKLTIRAGERIGLGRLGRRQDNAGEAFTTLLRSRRRAHSRGWAGHRAGHAGVIAPRDRSRGARPDVVPSSTGGEHCLRPARGDALGNQAGGATRSRRRLHRPAFRRLWHAGGRARRQALRRRTPARRHRPRHPRQFADPRAG